MRHKQNFSRSADCNPTNREPVMRLPTRRRRHCSMSLSKDVTHRAENVLGLSVPTQAISGDDDSYHLGVNLLLLWAPQLTSDQVEKQLKIHQVMPFLPKAKARHQNNIPASIAWGKADRIQQIPHVSNMKS